MKDYEIMQGDCVQVLAGMPRDSVDLIFADPPYNQGVDYGNGANADRLSEREYRFWADLWIQACFCVLKPHGSCWILVPDEWAAHYDTAARALGLHRRNWIKWYETFGVNCRRKFNRCSRHLLYYTRNKTRFTFNADAVNRQSDRQAKYGDKRADPNGKNWDDVWSIPRLAGSHKGRIPGFPTQLPFALLRPIVGCASNVGDLVLDPFSGSATTGIAALEGERRYIGIELSEAFCELSRRRLEMFVDECNK